jgi:UDPglucose 6-dehydrogenase
MENIGILGIGKLGICLALVLERAGYKVFGVDINQEYIDQINNRTLVSDEKDVSRYLADAKNLVATTDLPSVVAQCSILLIMVATPSFPDGSYDHSQIDRIIEQLSQLGEQKNTKHLVICCTTMPRYCETVYDSLHHLNYTVSYNPEFIAQGTIIRDLQNPDMVLIGESDKDGGNAVESIYYKILDTEYPIVNKMSLTEAEICKIALNCFLTTKIAFTNMIGDIASAAGCNPQKILDAIGDDTRIGKKCMKYGFGFSGPCLPRDNRALAVFAKSVDIYPNIAFASDDANNLHLTYMIEKFVKDHPDKSVPVTMDYVTYKPESTLITESQQLEFAKALKNLGYTVKVKDQRPAVLEQIKDIL